LKDKFVYTKSSLKLLEQIARCIECNEPVLLSGETGVGKTSALQHLAKLLGKLFNHFHKKQNNFILIYLNKK
jgi:midasin